jgi:hypothetical protein
MPKREFIVVLLVLVVSSGMMAPAVAEVLKQEPPMGQLREGQTVLVDDGTCPQGQIKQVIGGNHVKAGGTKHIVRTSRCIPR